MHEWMNKMNECINECTDNEWRWELHATYFLHGVHDQASSAHSVICLINLWMNGWMKGWLNGWTNECNDDLYPFCASDISKDYNVRGFPTIKLWVLNCSEFTSLLL